MNYKILVVAALAAAASWLVCTSSSDEPERRPRAHDSAEQLEPEPVGARPAPVYTHAERPRLPAPATEGSPSEPVERVDFDRRPWDPTQELDTVYERRAGLFEGFDRFREETGISQEKADAIMMLLYDYQETIKVLRKELDDAAPYRDKWEFEYLRRKESHAELLVSFDAIDAMDEMLSPEEMRSWTRNLEDINVWGRLSWWPYQKPMIIPIDRAPAACDQAAGGCG